MQSKPMQKVKEMIIRGEMSKSTEQLYTRSINKDKSSFFGKQI